MHRRSYIPGSDNKAGRPTHPEALTANIHRGTAARMFNVREQDVTEEQIKAAKRANFGAVYGQRGVQVMARQVENGSTFVHMHAKAEGFDEMVMARRSERKRGGFGGFVDKIKQVLNAPVTLPFTGKRKGGV